MEAPGDGGAVGGAVGGAPFVPPDTSSFPAFLRSLLTAPRCRTIDEEHAEGTLSGKEEEGVKRSRSPSASASPHPTAMEVDPLAGVRADEGGFMSPQFPIVAPAGGAAGFAPPAVDGTTLTSESEWERCSDNELYRGAARRGRHRRWASGSGTEGSESEWEVVTGGVPQGPEPPEVPSLREAPLGVASELLRPQALRDIAAALPSKLQGPGTVWRLIYRLDGVERQTGGLHGLSQALSAANGPTLLVVADTDGCRMGGFASVAWNLSPRYQGTGECFVFGTGDDGGENGARIFNATRADRRYMLLRPDSISLGGGRDAAALWMDADLLSGNSAACATFNSPSLAAEPEFTVYSVEAWALLGPTC